MNYARLVMAAAAAFIFDAAYGFLVYGMALRDQFGRYPGVYRQPEDTSHMPILFAGILVGMLTVAYIYAKGYEGGPGAAEGLRFGVALGVFVGGSIALVNWAVLNIGRTLAISMAAAGFVEWLLIGLIIGLVYKPVAGIAAVRAGAV
jgi:hypothetical protein